MKQLKNNIKKGIGFCMSLLRKNFKPVIISLSASVFLLITSYWLDSWAYPIGSDLSAGKWIERIKILCNGDCESVPDSIALVNVTYDKALMEYEALYDARNPNCIFREPVGVNSVTDRAKLLAFLEALDTVRYSFLVIDIRFEQGFESDSVSERLFNKIASMDRIVIARHKNYSFADSVLYPASALSDYYTTFLETDLVKYPLSSKGASIPDVIYSSRCGGNIIRHPGGLWYTDNGRLCYGSIFLTFPVKVTRWQVPVDKDKTDYTPLYSNLGADILSADIDMKSRFADRIIVVGDFVEDVHDTYLGLIPGALINLDAYLELAEGRHIINWFDCLLLFLLYFVISLTIVSRRSFSELIPFLKRTHSTVLQFALSFIGYSLILTLVAVAYYIFTGQIYSTAYPVLFFTCFSTVIKRKTIVAK